MEARFSVGPVQGWRYQKGKRFSGWVKGGSVGKGKRWWGVWEYVERVKG